MFEERMQNGAKFEDMDTELDDYDQEDQWNLDEYNDMNEQAPE